MPNWCECDLTICGEPAELERFLDFAKTTRAGQVSHFDFNQFISYPEEYRLLDEATAQWEKDHPDDPFGPGHPQDGYNQGGCEWCVANWGTKGRAQATSVEYCPDWERVEVHFETAWSPPLPVILRASKLFPELDFDLRYFEAGMGFHGMYVCKGGSVEVEKEAEYFGYRGG